MATRSGEQIDLRASVVRKGQRPRFGRDLYALLLSTKWRYLMLFSGTVYALTNALFAEAYLRLGDCIAGAEPGSYFDAYFFSVQTLATIGYGVMSPKGLCGHALVSIESLCGLLGLALMTGIVFSKFARPSAGVIFSKHAIITSRNGAPYLMFRVANERGNDIIEASMHVSVLMDEVMPEGQSLRRFYDLKLERNATPVLIMSWLVMHRIDEQSPLFGKSPQQFEDGDIRIMASLTGVDGTFMQTVYTYHQYSHVQIARDVEFHDVISRLPDGRFQLDLAKFDHIKPR
jgi:inward rectifier potassium channel